jgi:Tfp pilus assembly protein PilO
VKPFWRRRLLWPSLVLLGLNLAVFAAYTMPKTVQERTLIGRGAILREEVRQERKRAEGLRRRADTMTRNAEDVRRFYSKTLGTKASLLEVQRDLEAMARELGLRVGNRNYVTDEVRGADSVRRFEMTMQVKGTYAQLVSLLDRLERSPHFVTLDEVRLGRREGGETLLDLKLGAYFRVEEPPPPAPAGGRS